LDGQVGSSELAVMQASAAELEAAGFAESVGGDWRLPNSPEMALQLAQEDLAERLAHLYAEKVSLKSQTGRTFLPIRRFLHLSGEVCFALAMSAGVMARRDVAKVRNALG
jgi:hypothetical protein